MRVIGGGDSRRLTGPASGFFTDDFNPAWSPDGRRIAFLRRSGNTTQVLTIPAAGGAEKRIGEIHSSPMFEIHMRFLAWSPDPDELVVSDESPGHKDNLHLYRLNVATGSKVPMAETPERFSDISPVFSPDGRSLAFLRWGPDAAYELYVRSSDGGGERRLAASPDTIRNITWTADSRRIIYASGPSGPDRIWQVTSKGGRPELASFAVDGEAYQLTIAPRGHRLIYISRFWDTNVWRLNRGAAGGPRLQKLIASTREDSDPRYSPDGSRIAFTSRRSGKFDIWLCNSDGSNPRQLTFRGSSTGSASWSPDGRTIAFDSESGGGSEVWLVDSNGGEARPLLKPAMQAEIPNWSHDGRWIYFRSLHSGSPQIWKARPDAPGESPVQVTRNGGFEAVESGDGEFLYFTKSDTHSAQPTMGIWRMPLVDGSPEGPEELIGGTEAVGKDRCWAVTHSGIDFIDPAPKPRLRFLDFAIRSISTIGGFDLPPAPFQRALSVSPDGKSFLYVQVDRNVQEIRLVENFQ